MSAEIERFDTRRAVQSEENSEQTNFRAVGAREHGQLALNEIKSEAACSENQASNDTSTTTEEPTRADLEVALECARATIDGLREQVARLEAERKQLRDETDGEKEDDQ